MKTNKFVNFILEISQVFLVFLGVYSAIMCAVLSLAIPLNRLVATTVILGVTFLFYAFFTVLETFRHGKLYGMAGITAFFVLVIIRFHSVLQKGVVTMINTYLKAFMSYTQGNVALLSGKGFEHETASVEYCTTLVVILIASYLIAVISSSFYRKRRSSVFIAATILFFFVPITIGQIGYFSNVVTYLFVTMAVVGTRFLPHDTIDKRMRQKLSLVLVGVGVIAGAVTWFVIPPKRYEANQNRIVEVRNSALALTTWESEDLSAWLREYFSGDVLEYGKVGKKNQVNRSGKTLLKIKGDFDTSHGLYLKAYTAAEYSGNRWRQIKDESGQYKKDVETLSAAGLSVDSWHVALRNQIGESQTTGNSRLWNSGKLQIKNLSFGYGNYVVPYYPAEGFSSEGGRSTVSVPGIQYETEYFPILYSEMKKGLMANSYNLADNDYWSGNQENRAKLTEFAKKYYLGVPDSIAGIAEEYKNYLNSQDGLLDKFSQGAAPLYQIVEETRNFIMKDTEYTLSPGRTPGEKDAVTYFLQENKKGYCVHYATAAALLLRSIGIPTRYVEGLYISDDKLGDATDEHTEISVTDKDVHAWVEVYQENYGFVPLEFTPGRGDDDADYSSVEDEESEESAGQGGQSGQGGAGQDTAAPQEQEPGEQEKATPVPEEDMTFENIETENYNREEEPDAASGDSLSVKDDGQKPQSTKRPWWQILLLVVGGLVFVVVAAELQRRIRHALFRRNLRKRAFKKQIILSYRRMERVFQQKGVRYRGQSVEEYAGQIAEACDMKPGEVYPFVSTVFCASFSQESFGHEQMVRFRMVYRSIRYKLYSGANVARRFYYRYILCL